MALDEVVNVRIVAADDDDDEDLAELTEQLGGDLDELDVTSVDPLTIDAPAGTKAGLATLLGWLAVTVGDETLRRVVDRIAEWASGSRRSVEVEVNGQKLSLGHASRAEQRTIIDAWLASVAAGETADPAAEQPAR